MPNSTGLMFNQAIRLLACGCSRDWYVFVQFSLNRIQEVDQ